MRKEIIVIDDSRFDKFIDFGAHIHANDQTGGRTRQIQKLINNQSTIVNINSSPGNHRDQENFGLIWNQGFIKIRPGNVFVIDTNNGICIRVAQFLQEVGYGHTLTPRVAFTGYCDHG